MLGVWEERKGCLPGPTAGVRRKEIAMRDGHRGTGTRSPWLVLLGLLVLLLTTSAVPGHARSGGGHGGHGGGHGHHGFGHGGHHFGHGGPRFIGPSLGVSVWPYWTPSCDPYGVPAAVPPPHASLPP